MILASTQEVLDRVGLSERVGSVSTALSGLLSATPQLERSIGTVFKQEDRVDYFGAVTNLGTLIAPEYLLNLTRSFLDEDETVRLYVSSDMLPIVAVTGDAANVTEIVKTDFDVDHEHGRITTYLTDFNPATRRVLAVRYISGFKVASSDDDGDLAAQDKVPSALHDAAITLAIRTMRASTAPTPKINSLEQRKELSFLAKNLIAGFIRTRMVGEHPQSTELK